jgi:hypothetical protein
MCVLAVDFQPSGRRLFWSSSINLVSVVLALLGVHPPLAGVHLGPLGCVLLCVGCILGLWGVCCCAWVAVAHHRGLAGESAVIYKALSMVFRRQTRQLCSTRVGTWLRLTHVTCVTSGSQEHVPLGTHWL